MPEPGEPVGFTIRQRLQQNAVDDAEDGGIRADADSQRDERGGGESGGTKETSENVTGCAQKGTSLRDNTATRAESWLDFEIRCDEEDLTGRSGGVNSTPRLS
jgi:hypothetical protein